jgi:hypothetical protein
MSHLGNVERLEQLVSRGNEGIVRDVGPITRGSAAKDLHSRLVPLDLGQCVK